MKALDGKFYLVPDDQIEAHIPDFILTEMVDYISSPSLDILDMRSFGKLVSRYNPDTDSFEQVTLPDGTVVLPVYARHLKNYEPT